MHNLLGSWKNGAKKNRNPIPAIAIPTMRRIYPELISHDIVGVQPMSEPTGFAFALRHQYGQKYKNGAKKSHK
jgi:hypothetical protein